MTRADLLSRSHRHSEPPPSIMRPTSYGSGGFDNFGSFLKSVADQKRQQADGTPARPDSRLLSVRSALGSHEATPSMGGFLIQPEFSQELLKLTYDTGDVLRRVKTMISTRPDTTGLIVPMPDESARTSGKRFGGIASAWGNAGDAIQASKPKFRRAELNAKSSPGWYS